MSSCAQCGRTAIHGYETETGSVLPLCLEHSALYQQMAAAQAEVLQQQAHDLEDAIADVYGMPRTPRPARVRQEVKVMGDINRVNIQGSPGANLNIRSRVEQAQAVTVNVTDNALRESLAQLVATINAAPEFSEPERDSALQLATAVGEESAKPAAERRPAVITATLSTLGTMAQKATAVYSVVRIVATLLGYPLP